MASAFIKSLPDNTKIWYAHATAGMMISDGKLDDAELFYLKGVLMFLDDKEVREELIAEVKEKKLPQLDNLKTDRETATRLLIELAIIGFLDDHLTKSEASYFMEVGEKLGFHRYFSKLVIDWGLKNAVVEKERKHIFQQGVDLEPNYKETLDVPLSHG